MKIAPSAALSLAAVIRNDLEAIVALETHVDGLPEAGLRRTELDSMGFALHNLCSALENAFTQISLSFENDVRDRTRWHRELLEKMFLDLGVLRPAVLSAEVRPVLTDLLGFRHLFRHAYDFTLDETKTLALRQHWKRKGPAVKEALGAFAARLTVLGQQARPDVAGPDDAA